jgi:ABC-type sugar transport system permease subunit
VTSKGSVRENGSILPKLEGPARSRRFARGGSRQEGSWWAQLREAVFVAPITLLIALVIVVPTVTVVIFSFTAWNPGFESPFVGVDNYVQLAKSPGFLQILRNQAFFLVTVLPLGLLAPLVLAVLLHDRVPFPGAFRTVYFFPAIVSPAVIGILFSFLLTPDGPLDATLEAIGLGSWSRLWLVDPGYVKPVVTLIFLWGSIGVGVVIFGAGLSAIPPELLELAELDGPSWWQRFFRVILPALSHLVVLWVVILLISTFVAMFPWIFTTTRGGPGFASSTLDFDIYRNSLRFGFFGLAAAEVVYLLIIVGVIVGVGARAFRSRGATAP